MPVTVEAAQSVQSMNGESEEGGVGGTRGVPPRPICTILHACVLDPQDQQPEFVRDHRMFAVAVSADSCRTQGLWLISLSHLPPHKPSGVCVLMKTTLDYVRTHFLSRRKRT